MKKCFKCGIWKTLDRFYKHPQMGDGHLNKCIRCAKNDVRDREKILKENPNWVKKERKRHREKYYRLNYKEKHKPTASYKKAMMKAYRNKYPEKYFAKNRVQRMVTPSGFEKHHWSYNEEHYKDIIFLTRKDHSKLHRYTIYDQERMMFRSLEGILLDTKEEHLRYYKVISGLE